MNNSCEIKTLHNKEYRCFFELTLHVMGGKWKPIILYQLAVQGVLRFSELRRAIPGITERMLTRQLRELEADSLVHRKVYRQIPPKVEYSLLPAGVRLIPVLLSMREWGVIYEQEQNPQARHCQNKYEQKEPPRIASVYRDQLEEPVPQ